MRKNYALLLLVLAPLAAWGSQIRPDRVYGRYVAIGNNGRVWTHADSNISQRDAERKVLYSCPSCIVTSGTSCCATSLSYSYRRTVDYGVACADTVNTAAHEARKACESVRGLECSTTGAVCNR